MAGPTLFRADWVLPVTAAPLRAGAVLARDGRIEAVGPAAAVPCPADAEVVELGASVLLPGLVNVHAHPDLALFRGALEDLPFGDWIARLVRVQRAALRAEHYHAAARWSLVEAVRAGITTLTATEASGAAMPALLEAGLRGVVYQEVFGPDPAQADASMQGLRDAVRALRRAESERVRVGVSPHAPYSVSDALYQRAASWAADEGLPVAVHIAESADERALVRRGGGRFAEMLRGRGIAVSARGASPIELLERLGVLRARPLLIHCVDVDADDVRRIADAGCAVAHCPIANAKLGHGVAPLGALREAGVAVGLGSDGVGSNNRVDLLEEARFAALLQRALHREPAALPAAELLRLCTLDGARALGLDDQIGSLEPGKRADLCAVSLAAPHARPVHDPVAALFHAARGTDVLLTVVEGEVLYRDGRVLRVDEAAAAREVEQAAERVREVA